MNSSGPGKKPLGPWYYQAEHTPPREAFPTPNFHGGLPL